MTDESLWQKFALEEHLSQHQLDQFKLYVELLEQWQPIINLTAIKGTENVINNHFLDSLKLASCIDMQQITTIADVGTGGGFPAIPLKIKYPHLKLILIEVNQKKVMFLLALVQAFNLVDVEVVPLDWRTFLRTTAYEVDLFVARASLHTDELMRMFKPGCHYSQARLIYWASQEWQPQESEKAYRVKECPYTVGNKKRRYIVFDR